jgi:hypothetical protein
VREAVQEVPVQRSSRGEDPAGPGDPPVRAFRNPERCHARIGRLVRPGRGIQTTQLITRPPQLGLSQQPQVALGPLIAHPPSLHPRQCRGCQGARTQRTLPAKLIAGVVYAAPRGRTFCLDIPRPEPVPAQHRRDSQPAVRVHHSKSGT